MFVKEIKCDFSWNFSAPKKSALLGTVLPIETKIKDDTNDF